MILSIPIRICIPIKLTSIYRSLWFTFSKHSNSIEESAVYILCIEFNFAYCEISFICKNCLYLVGGNGQLRHCRNYVYTMYPKEALYRDMSIQASKTKMYSTCLKKYVLQTEYRMHIIKIHLMIST